ncbi:helix-turn-helix domain-containing protein [Parachryseolinea silvisoli]|uniref:helix-turn-helix domain-containing protein n=1 Tax=Parachryseolinea silvisoli TaxID=2873601 RepID=UPI0022658E70|nr:helix-turn-helix domain-containing protein [Parachryseolinea silvisoli]MCD9017006.1 AraC family transcriptional regulator [Parachryseolinea silvisoli]
MSLFKQFTHKKIGIVKFDTATALPEVALTDKSYNRILFLRAGSALRVDFQKHTLRQDSLFFIGSNQFFEVEDNNRFKGYVIYFNRDFYCIQIHEKEVSCDGILYNNVYGTAAVTLTKEHALTMEAILEEIADEMQRDDTAVEEMLRILVKKVIIKSTRLWKENAGYAQQDDQPEAEFLRQFSQLVESHFRKRHGVADYADLLNITPKALSKRLNRYRSETPNDIIKDRIMLEAKRLLLYTDMTVKEIAYNLGYEDPAYFNRLFVKTTGIAPAEFRRQPSGIVKQTG